jgi:hypothetical protein
MSRRRLPNNWRDRIELVIMEDSATEWSFTLQFKQGETPRGFKKIIGTLDVTLKHGGKHYFVDSMFLEAHFHNRKLGLLLYETAIKHLGSLTSCYWEASVKAKRAWKSIVRRYDWECDFFGGFLTVFNRNPRKSKRAYETLATFKSMTNGKQDRKLPTVSKFRQSSRNRGD